MIGVKVVSRKIEKSNRIVKQTPVDFVFSLAFRSMFDVERSMFGVHLFIRRWIFNVLVCAYSGSVCRGYMKI